MSVRPVSSSPRLTELEAVRGIAAVIVFVHHYIMAFAPALHGRYNPGDFALVRSPLFALVNGSASVVLFFVLSGFVLTQRAFKQQSVRPLVVSAVRRWPRLMLPVLVVNIFAGALYAYDLFYSQQAAPVTHSTLLTFLYAPPKPAAPIFDALKEGIYGTFLFNRFAYNNNLWTMYYEFFGSFMVFGIAAVGVTIRRLGIPAIILACIVAGRVDITFLPMLVGCLVAYLFSYYPLAKLPPKFVLIGLAAVTVILYGYDGYSKPAGFYSFLEPIHGDRLRTVAHTVAGVLIITYVLYSPTARRVLSGQVALFLGRLSFPLYLTHLIVIASLSSWIAVQIVPQLGLAVSSVILLPVTVGATLLVSWPLMSLEKWWLTLLRRIRLREYSTSIKSVQTVPLIDSDNAAA
jgi:peptidoglycan/LPS O-acetylase OafA/YrhL